MFTGGGRGCLFLLVFEQYFPTGAALGHIRVTGFPGIQDGEKSGKSSVQTAAQVAQRIVRAVSSA